MSVTLFKIGFLPVTIMDILDIIVMAYIIYRIYTFLRGTRGAQMMVGLIFLLLLSVIAPIFQLKGVSWIFNNLKTVWLLAFVIVFQPELRRLLITMGQNRIIRLFFKVTGNRVIDEIVKATLELRDKGYGALIVLARESGLRMISETGVKIQAEVTTPLILSIFNPRSPLHDGAIIVQNDIIEAAKCTLPISHDSDATKEFGTRHKAALTLSQESDALIIIVSEERGKISIAVNGELYYDLSEEQLRKLLITGFTTAQTKMD